MKQPRIVIIDAHHGQLLGAQIQALLQQERRYRVDLRAQLPPEGVDEAPCPALFIPVLPVSQEQASQLVATLQAQATDTPVLPVMRAVDLHPMLHELFPGTADVLILPIQAADVCAQVERLMPGSRDPVQGRGDESWPEACGLASMIGEDPAFLAVKRKIPLLAQCEAPVLLTGETGTGKELCARALHYSSRRRGRPFLPVNCGAIPGMPRGPSPVPGLLSLG